MKPSERIHEIAQINAGSDSDYDVTPLDIIEYLDEQEQSSHAAKGDHSFPCGPCGGTGNLPGHYDAERNWHQGIKCQTCKGSGRPNESAKAEQHGGGRARHAMSAACVCGQTWGAHAAAKPHGIPGECDAFALDEPSKSPAPDGDGGTPPLTQAMRARIERRVAERIESTRPAVAAQLREIADSRDADGGEEDGARELFVVEFDDGNGYVFATREKEYAVSQVRKYNEPCHVTRYVTEEALGRAEAERDEAQRQYGVMCEFHKSAMVAVELCTRERQDETERAEKAEARLAAWRGMVPALHQLWDTQHTSALAPLMDAVGAVLTAYDQLPAEEQKTGGEGG